ncbi:hypothetical protein ABG067_003632 [Albugo candida]
MDLNVGVFDGLLTQKEPAYMPQNANKWIAECKTVLSRILGGTIYGKPFHFYSSTEHHKLGPLKAKVSGSLPEDIYGNSPLKTDGPQLNHCANIKYKTFPSILPLIE